MAENTVFRVFDGTASDNHIGLAVYESGDGQCKLCDDSHMPLGIVVSREGNNYSIASNGSYAFAIAGGTIPASYSTDGNSNLLTVDDNSKVVTFAPSASGSFGMTMVIGSLHQRVANTEATSGQIVEIFVNPTYVPSVLAIAASNP